MIQNPQEFRTFTAKLDAIQSKFIEDANTLESSARNSISYFKTEKEKLLHEQAISTAVMNVGSSETSSTDPKVKMVTAYLNVCEQEISKADQ